MTLSNKLSALLFAIVGLFLNSCTPSSTDPSDIAPNCRAAVPRFLTDVTRGELRPISSQEIIFAGRDETVTVIGICSEAARLPADPPFLNDGGKPIESTGGLLRRGEKEFVNFMLFPPTDAGSVTVEEENRVLAQVNFSPISESTCDFATNFPFRVLDCEALLTIRWQTRLQYRARDLQLVDVTVKTGSRLTPTQGFYLHDLSGGKRGLVITFGTEVPKRDVLDIELSKIYIEKNGHARQRIIRPAISARLRLRDRT